MQYAPNISSPWDQPEAAWASASAGGSGGSGGGGGAGVGSRASTSGVGSGGGTFALAVWVEKSERSPKLFLVGGIPTVPL